MTSVPSVLIVAKIPSFQPEVGRTVFLFLPFFRLFSTFHHILLELKLGNLPVQVRKEFPLLGRKRVDVMPKIVYITIVTVL